MGEKSKNEKSNNRVRTQWIGFGMAVGAGIGVALDNIPIGITLGLVFGLAIGNRQLKKAENE